MVSFFISDHRDDESFVAVLIGDALTARFGRESVFPGRSLAVGVDDADRRRRLVDSSAMIVVIGRTWRGSEDGVAGGLSDTARREVETALALTIPVIAVLVGDARQPTDRDLPPSLWPLSRLEAWRIRVRSAYSDNRRLIDMLETRFDTDPKPTGPTMPVLLNEEPVRLVMPPPAHHRAAIVYSTRKGDLEVADSGTPTRWSLRALARYSTRYEVDIGVHRVNLEVLLPAKDHRHRFTARIAVDVRVTDPAAVVRRAVTDAVPAVRASLIDAWGSITRRFTVHELAHAKTAIGQWLDRDMLAPGGITLRAVRARLTLGDRELGYLRDRDEGRLSMFSRATPRYRRKGFWNSAFPAHREAARGRPNSTRPGAGQRPERLLVARAPSQVPAGRDLSLDVRLVTEGRSVHPNAVTARLANLSVADEGTPVTVTVHAPSGLHAEGPLQQTMLVKPGEDPAPVRFGFGARTPGLHRIDVAAWAGGTFLGEVSVEVSVSDGGPFRSGRAQAGLLEAPQARPGEVTMEVRFDGSRYTFQLRSEAALFAPVVESVANTPNAAVENAIRELQQLAGGSRYSATMTREVIRSAGIQLWSEMVPADVRDQFWQVGATMSAFTIATDHDVVPWELLYPLSAQQDAGFLVEQVPVVRRTYGQHRSATIGLRNPRFVVPPKAPTGAHEEIATIRAILGAADSAPITSADDLLALINSGALGATHFACHNTFSSDGSYIDMDGGRFKPSLLAEARIRKLLEATGPLVFINACRSAGVAPTYTRMLGWAQQFMASGAGAFVGTLWAVRSESSARFATSFYRSLAEGATLGAAALAARTDQQDDPLDPTWLAYAVYGDPFATAAL
ncbi:CHAT domain-containing protein [Micromonospora sp. NPDC005189]|uniref:CHAT domain-containing protein n=1 Tax=Micromonospora sp. NPDC005189 TaxID=3157019 RepID=UPI0033A0178D